MQAQGFGRKNAPGNTSFGATVAPRAQAVAPRPSAAAQDSYAAQRGAFIAQERSAGLIDPPDRVATMAWDTPTSGLSWQKSRTVAYLLWFFLGAVAAHRLYLGRYLSGGAQTLLGLVWVCMLISSPHQISVWGSLMMIFGTWRLLDLFLIPGMCRTPPAAY